MKILFQKNDPSIYDTLIRWWTHSPYSHCALVFDDRVVFQAEAGIGTHFTQTAILSANVWDALEIKLDPDSQQAVMTFCNLEDKCGYDWVGIFFSQIIRMQRSSKNKWFCSEVCVAALQRVGLLPNVVPCTVSPGQLYKRLKEAGATPCVP